jgi:dienelactone hydrolase
VLDEDRAFYQGLKWADRSSDHLAVLKGVPDSARADTLYSLLWYTDISRGAPRGARFDPQRDPAVPTGMTIGTTEPLRWSEDREAIFFGIRPVRERPVESATPSEPHEKVDLVLWHWNEPRVQSQQQRESARDDAYTFLAVYHLRTMRFVRLADDVLREVEVAPRGKWALGWDARAYATDNWLTGRHHADLYAVDVGTGARRLLVTRYLLIYGVGSRPKRYFLSPDGVHVLTWADGAYTVHSMVNGESHPLVGRGGPTFGSQPYDYSPHHARIGPLAWSKDGAVVILSDGWDLWAVPITSGTPVNLTVDGRRNGIQYGGVVGVASELTGHETIDLSAPWYVWAVAEWGMATGYVRINGRTPGARRVLWDAASVSWATKARDADVVAFRRGTAIAFPDYYLTDLSFSDPRRITDANPQQRELLWPSGVRLVDYTGPSGERLQAALLLPANYQKGKRYPAITLIYERESFRRNSYAAPTEWGGGGGGEGTGVDATLYASRGYVIIFPDIHYLKDRPGTSALHCVLGAARAAVAAGVVDSTRVGLAGHSWGGYESAFIATQTSFFKAVLAAAGPTDLISEYGGIRGGGRLNSAITESDQVRLTNPYWRDLESYIRESSIFHVDKVTTPILLVHNEADDAVGFHNGIEFFNAMRRAKKPIVMLQYVGQGHVSGGRDLGRRAQEFFDHFLMAAAAPKWWTDGVPYRKTGSAQ